jgi:hypothetical protein
MSDWRDIVRLGLAPLLLLGWNMSSGQPLAYIGPILAVFLLTPGGARPPVGQMLQILLLVVAITGLLSRCFLAVADSPASVWVLLLALATGCFAQLAVKPQNMPALLMLMVALLVTALIQSDPHRPAPCRFSWAWPLQRRCCQHERRGGRRRRFCRRKAHRGGTSGAAGVGSGNFAT